MNLFRLLVNLLTFIPLFFTFNVLLVPTFITRDNACKPLVVSPTWCLSAHGVMCPSSSLRSLSHIAASRRLPVHITPHEATRKPAQSDRPDRIAPTLAFCLLSLILYSVNFELATCYERMHRVSRTGCHQHRHPSEIVAKTIKQGFPIGCARCPVPTLENNGGECSW